MESLIFSTSISATNIARMPVYHDIVWFIGWKCHQSAIFSSLLQFSQNTHFWDLFSLTVRGTKIQKKNAEVERGWYASMKTFSTQGTKIQKNFVKKYFSTHMLQYFSIPPLPCKSPYFACISICTGLVKMNCNNIYCKHHIKEFKPLN